MRVTKELINNRFKDFIESIGGRVATNATDTGGYYLDKGYGGYVINKVINDLGGVTCPWGYRRMSAKELLYTLDFGLNTTNELHVEIIRKTVACNNKWKLITKDDSNGITPAKP